MKFLYVMFAFNCALWAMVPSSDWEHKELAIERLGGEKRCEKIVEQWSTYEKRLLATVLAEPKWPSHRVGGPLYFAKQKEIYPDRFLAFIGNEQITVLLNDFKVLVQLHHVPKFDSYEKQMCIFAHMREHFDTEDQTWDHMERQLSRCRP